MPEPKSEAELQLLESRFPSVSGSVFAAARERVLASGQSVLQSEGGSIYEVFPDGRKEFVKSVEPPMRLASGLLWKYSSLSCALTFAANPVMRTCRSNSFQKKTRQARGFSCNSRPLKLS